MLWYSANKKAFIKHIVCLLKAENLMWQQFSVRYPMKKILCFNALHRMAFVVKLFFSI